MALIVGGTTVTGTQTLDATKLTGALPAISGGNLTDVVNTSVEGDWTPSCSDGTMTVAEGRYYKVGKLVMCVAAGEFATRTGTGTTRWTINNLPFTASNSTGGTYSTVRTAGSGNCNFRDRVDLQVVVHPNSTKVRFFSNGGANLDDTEISPAGGGNENISALSNNQMVVNKNMRHASNPEVSAQGGTNTGKLGAFYLFFIYRSKT